MLKLMKYEVIHSVRTFLNAFIIFLAGCIVMPFAIRFLAGNGSGKEYVLGFLGLFFMILIVGICFSLFVSIFINYKQSMFGRTGYLTLTLPKSNLEIVVSKLIVALCWLLVGFAILVCGLYLMVYITAFLEGIFPHINGVSITFTIIGSILNHNLVTLVIVAFEIMSGFALIVSLIYFCLTITQTKWIKKYKLVISLILFFVFCILFCNTEITRFIFLALDLSVNFVLLHSLINIALLSLFIASTVYILNNHIEIV